jgi:hypothetical protein
MVRKNPQNPHLVSLSPSKAASACEISSQEKTITNKPLKHGYNFQISYPHWPPHSNNFGQTFQNQG